MSDATGFLLARIAEDEEWARFVAADLSGATWWWTVDGELPGGERTTAYHPASHGPERVLAECEAKRRIVAAATLGLRGFSLEVHLASLESNAVILRTLAAVYADHPDYDEAWRP